MRETNDQQAARPRRRRTRWLALTLLALGALLALVIHDVVKQPPPPDYAVVPGHSALAERPAPGPAVGQPACEGVPRRWIVVGWDGASWDVLGPLLDAGELPHLARLIDAGAHGDLNGFRPSLSPALWTTVATGVSPARHGIRGFEKPRHRLRRRLDRLLHLGRRRRELYSNADRRVPALWNLMRDAGRPSLVVGYHNTFPAEEITGAMVSNYVVQAYIQAVTRAGAPPAAEMARSLVHPAEWTDGVLDVERDVRAGIDDALQQLADVPPDELAAFLADSRSLGPPDRRRPWFLRQVHAFDTFHAQVAQQLYPRVQPELLLVHFQGIDLASHYFLPFHDPARFEAFAWPDEARRQLEQQAAIYGQTLVRVHRRLDTLLGELLALGDSDTAVLLLSDHGFQAEDDPWRGGHHDDAPPGIVVAAGPGIRRGVRIQGASLYDVLPTLAAGLGLPVARDLPGRPLRELFCEASWARLDVAFVDGYAAGEAFVPSIAPPADWVDGIRRDLEALGYVD